MVPRNNLYVIYIPVYMYCLGFGVRSWAKAKKGGNVSASNRRRTPPEGFSEAWSCSR